MKTCRGTCEPTRTDPRLAETRALYRSSPTETRDVACAWFCQTGRESGLLPFLAVGSCLRERGFEIAAEPCPDRRPLWRAERRATTPAFLVDVVPIDLSQDELLEFRISSGLVETLQSIPVNQRLHMAVTDFRRILDEESRERIVEKTRDWLAAKRLSVGDRLQLHGAILTMMPRDKLRDHLAVVGPAPTYWIRKLKIDVILLDRVLQQREAAAEHPYVLAAVAPERVGLSRRCYKRASERTPGRAGTHPAGNAGRYSSLSAIQDAPRDQRCCVGVGKLTRDLGDESNPQPGSSTPVAGWDIRRVGVGSPHRCRAI